MREIQFASAHDAARALHVSPATLRRWARDGRIRALLTPGGHRRYPISEIRRIRREMSAVTMPEELTAPPSAPLPLMGQLLQERGRAALARASAEGALTLAGYSGTRGRLLVQALTAGCAAGSYERARRTHLDCLRDAVLDGATPAGCIRMFNSFSRAMADELDAVGALLAERRGWRLLRDYLQESAVDQFTGGGAAGIPADQDWHIAWPVLRRSPLGYAVVDHGGTVLVANEAFGALAGASPHRLRGQPLGTALATGGDLRGLDHLVGERVRAAIRTETGSVEAVLAFERVGDPAAGPALLVSVAAPPGAEMVEPPLRLLG